jgi:hypothetical protein
LNQSAPLKARGLIIRLALATLGASSVAGAARAAEPECILRLDTDPIGDDGKVVPRCDGGSSPESSKFCHLRWGCPFAPERYYSGVALKAEDGGAIKTTEQCQSALRKAWAECHGMDEEQPDLPARFGALARSTGYRATLPAGYALPEGPFIPHIYGADYWSCRDRATYPKSPDLRFSYGEGTSVPERKLEDFTDASDLPTIFASYTVTASDPSMKVEFVNSFTQVSGNTAWSPSHLYSKLRNSFMAKVPPPKMTTLPWNDTRKWIGAFPEWYEETAQRLRVLKLLKMYAKSYGPSPSVTAAFWFDATSILPEDPEAELTAPHTPHLGKMLGHSEAIRRLRRAEGRAENDPEVLGHAAKIKEAADDFLNQMGHALVASDPGAMLTLYLMYYYPESIGLMDPVNLDPANATWYANLGVNGSAKQYDGAIIATGRVVTSPSLSEKVDKIVKISSQRLSWDQLGMNQYTPPWFYVPGVSNGIGWLWFNYRTAVSFVPVVGSAMELMENALNIYEGRDTSGQEISVGAESAKASLNTVFLAMDLVPIGKWAATTRAGRYIDEVASKVRLIPRNGSTASITKRMIEIEKDAYIQYQNIDPNVPIVQDVDAKMVSGRTLAKDNISVSQWAADAAMTAGNGPAETKALAATNPKTWMQRAVYFFGHGQPTGVVADGNFVLKDPGEFLEFLKRTAGWQEGNDIVFMSCSVGVNLGPGHVDQQFAQQLANLSKGRVYGIRGVLFTPADTTQLGGVFVDHRRWGRDILGEPGRRLPNLEQGRKLLTGMGDNPEIAGVLANGYDAQGFVPYSSYKRRVVKNPINAELVDPYVWETFYPTGYMERNVLEPKAPARYWDLMLAPPACRAVEQMQGRDIKSCGAP